VSLNIFDVAVYAAGLIAVVTGFNVGLIRSLATILGYLAAAPIAVATTSLLAPRLAAGSDAPWAQNSMLLFGIFLLAGIILGKLLRTLVDEMLGPSVNIFDRLAGALLGAARVVLIAITLVLVFDRIIPPGRQPAFLSGSTLRPILSAAAQAGLKSLPPDITNMIDRLKRERGI
jgi:membrane protein required for colicin V production